MTPCWVRKARAIVPEKPPFLMSAQTSVMRASSQSFVVLTSFRLSDGRGGRWPPLPLVEPARQARPRPDRSNRADFGISIQRAEAG